MKVLFVFRKKRQGANSIEELFDDIIFNYQGECSKIELPFYTSGFFSMVMNTLFILFYSIGRDVIHITGDVHYVSTLLFHKKTILTIHDISSILRGNVFSVWIKKVIWIFLPVIFCRKITTISHYTKDQLIDSLGFLRFYSHKIIVVNNPVNTKLSYVKKQMDSIPVIFHIGTGWNKNLNRVIEAIAGIRCKLIVLGKLSDSDEKNLIDNNVLYENYYQVPYEKVALLYAKSDIVSFPSIYEGFGMPIIEANKSGRPVLTSNKSPMKDIAGNAACLVDPTDVISIRSGFLKIIEHKEYREKIVQNGFNNVNNFEIGQIVSKYSMLYENM